MVDLSTNYLGLKLKNPLVAGASPLTKDVDSVKELEDAGIGAVVMHSLFEEQVVHESKALNYFLTRGSDSFAEALTYFPDLATYNVGPEKYLELIRNLKQSVEIPVIASLNSASSGGWLDYAHKIEQAGADALELNIYYVPTELDLTARELEESYIDLVTDVNKAINIPLAVKLSPFFTALPNLAQRLVKAGADGLVFFNRFYQPDLDIETLEVLPNLVLSTSDDLRLPLRWIAILFGRLDVDFALTSGVHTAVDVLKSIMAGACATQMTSALLTQGVQHIKTVLNEMETWMGTYEYVSIQQMMGSMSQKGVKEPAAFERANYMKILGSLDNKLPF